MTLATFLLGMFVGVAMSMAIAIASILLPDDLWDLIIGSDESEDKP